ncbi:MAG: 6-phosphofructokinase [Chloroflexota bacterium]|nr:6-phosphofructokinase [Chloroflexota bacterium]
MKTVIVVNGGDAPGINAAIAAYTRLAGQNGDRVIGAQGGFAGLLSGQLTEIDQAAVGLLSGRGGSWLRSSRAPALARPDAGEGLSRVLTEEKIDNLLLFGGDGTIKFVLPRLQTWGLSCIALPATIDNDVPGTDYTLGHDSACNYAWQTIEGIRATANALPGRIFLVETLGGDSGYLALAIAYACAADVVLLPEYDFGMDWLAQRLKITVARRGYALLVLSEGVTAAERLTDEIPKMTGIRVRLTRLGHAQRGAAASHIDRQRAVDMSRIAYEALKRGPRAGIVVSRDGALMVQEGEATDAGKPAPDYQQYAFVNGL